jgi:signal transduction histidine kinase
MLLVVLAAVVALGVPLAIVGQQLLRQETHQRLLREAGSISTGVEDEVERGARITEPTLARLAPDDRRVVFTRADGTTTAVGPTMSHGVSAATVHLGEGGSVRVEQPASVLRDRVAGERLLVGLLALGAALVGVALAVVQARRLSRPLLALSHHAARLGAGHLREKRQLTGIHEVDDVGAALDRSAQQMAADMERERRFAGEVSHQLRTPLTALRIRLEELATVTPDPHAAREAHAAIDQMDRLATTVSDLLSLARSRTRSDLPGADAASVVLDQVRSWEPAFRRARRPLRGPVDVPAAPTAVSAAVIGQAVSSLLDNALQHGVGEVAVEVRTTSEHVTVAVSDEGDGPSDAAVAAFEGRAEAGRGIGLTLARTLVERDGGRLELVRRSPPTFQLFLPAGER